MPRISGGCAAAGMPRLSGFVLAEVITVAVILGILAAIAIPVYSGYLRNQKRSVAKNIAHSGAAAANIYCRRVDCTATPPDSASLKLFLAEPTRYAISVSGDYVIVTDISDYPDTLMASVKFR